MSRFLPGVKIFNFGFSSCNLNKQYLDNARRLLRKDAKEPHIVIGVSPHCLLRRKPERNAYLKWVENDDINRKKIMALVLLQSLGVRRLRNRSFKISRWVLAGNLKQRFHYDGWVATDGIDPDPMEYVQRLEEIFDRHIADQTVIDELIASVRRFSEQGIKVWGFRPPTNQSMVALENQVRNLFYPELIQEFKLAGGCWLDIPQDGYDSFDGSHLDINHALKLSEQVARQIAALTLEQRQGILKGDRSTGQRQARVQADLGIQAKTS
jgi:hypothetical protein